MIHTFKPIPDRLPRTYYKWKEMSVGSHYSIWGTDKSILKNALASMNNFRKTQAPFARFVYRTNRGHQRKGWTFWRVR